MLGFEERVQPSESFRSGPAGSNCCSLAGDRQGLTHLLDQRWQDVAFAAALGIILLARLALNICILSGHGWFFMATGDDLARSLLAYDFSQCTDFRLVQGLWNACPMWLNGVFLKIYPHPTVVLPVINTIVGLASIVLVARITRDLLHSRWLAVAAACVVAFQPVLIWLSLSGLADGLGILALLVGLFGWVRYRIAGSRWMVLLRACGYLAATMVKIEYAAFAGGFSLLVIYEAWRLRGSGKSWGLAACIPLTWLFVVAFLIWWKVTAGSFFAFSTVFKAVYEHEWIAARTASPWTRLLFYPSMMCRNWPMWLVLACIGLLFSLRTRDMRRTSLEMIVLSVLPFTALCVAAMTSGVPANLEPGPRHVAPYMVFLFVPAMFAVPALGQRIKLGTVSYMVLACLVAWTAVADIPKALSYQCQSPAVVIQLGRALGGLWDTGAIGGQDMILFEPGHNSTMPPGGAVLDSLTVQCFQPGNIIVSDRQLSGRTKCTWIQDPLDSLQLPPALGTPSEEGESARRRCL